MDRLGIPAVIVAYEEFERPARTQLKVMGLPDLPLVILPGLRVGATAESADSAFERITRSLTIAAAQRAPL